MSIQRYSFDVDGVDFADDNGSWVLYDEHVNLVDEAIDNNAEKVEALAKLLKLLRWHVGTKARRGNRPCPATKAKDTLRDALDAYERIT